MKVKIEIPELNRSITYLFVTYKKNMEQTPYIMSVIPVNGIKPAHHYPLPISLLLILKKTFFLILLRLYA